MNYQRVYMNQIYSSSLLGQLAHMWKNQLLCDAIIRTGQVITKAHRVVLVAACPMLQSMENASSGSHLEVRLAADIKQEAVNTFLQYLYEGYMMLTEENCRDVEKVARLLQVDNVSRCCADFYKCMQSKTGTNLGGSQYKYSGQDTTDFRHVRATELQKTVQDRMLKRSSEFHRPGSPGIKRARVHRGGSPDVTVIGADKADDTASMANSYMSAPDPWDRVPRPGAMLSKGASGKSQPGVIDIVEESLELVQTEPHDKDSGGSQGTSSRVAQKTSMAISVASQFNTDPDISIVNVTGNKENSTSSQPSRGSITVSPLPIFSDSQSHREMPGPSSSSHRQQESPRQQESQMYIREHPTSTPVRQSFSNQSKPFAAGSALQTSSISSPASSGTPPMGSPSTSKSNRTSRPDSSGEDRGKDHRSASVENQDMPPDLSIVKVESNVLDDTGGLDMHVDMPEAGVMQLHPGRLPQGGEDQEEPSDTEIEDWAREEMSNEGSNVSGDQNNSWYMGTFKEWLISVGESPDFEQLQSYQLDRHLASFYQFCSSKEDFPIDVLQWYPIELSRYLSSPPFNRDMDITFSHDFYSSNRVLESLHQELKLTPVDMIAVDECGTKPITVQHLRTLYNSNVLDKNNPTTLQNKVWIDINLHFGVLSRLELRRLRKTSLILETDPDNGRRYYKLDVDNCPKNRTSARMYEQPGSPYCPVESMNLYLSQLHPNSSIFFQQPKRDSVAWHDRCWYLETAVGKNVHSNKLATCCSSAGIKQYYRNTALRILARKIQTYAPDYTPAFSDTLGRMIQGISE